MGQKMSANYAYAAEDLTQVMLDEVSDSFCASPLRQHAYLKLGNLHGVTIQVEAPLTTTGEIPALVRCGLVMRCLIPCGTDLEVLTASLAGGEIGQMIDIVLAGHRLDLTSADPQGSLTPAAERARNKILQALDRMSPSKFLLRHFATVLPAGSVRPTLH